MELNDHYCFKKLVVNAGEELSLQYHRHKDETIHIASGRGLLQEGKFPYFPGQLTHTILLPGTTVHISPMVVHKIKAFSELVIYEASTPEVEDVIRLEDRYGRTG